jgi:hypothetical protein
MREFPDYDNEEFFREVESALQGLGFVDASYHHDEMPSFYNEAKEQYVYVNYRDDPILFVGNVYHNILFVDMRGLHSQDAKMKGYHVVKDLVEDLEG